jgi:metal-responsive CopG/Arc/MetJ family transcriptional regulator
MTEVILQHMKAAISVPDSVFKAADRLAKRRRMSRSELYTRAIMALLKAEDEAEITAQLDRAYAEPADSALPPELRTLPARILEKEDW